jgi:translation initiation factor IF-3
MDYGKYRYEQTKREKETHKKHQSGKLKELRIRPFIEHHDYNVKLEQAKDFLHKKCKVKLSMFFRGREIVHKNSGMEVLNKFINDLNEFGAVESPPKTLGKMVLVTLGPVSSKHTPKKKEEGEEEIKAVEQQTIKKTDTQNQ